jgi:iron complex outermembrane recepter protein
MQRLYKTILAILPLLYGEIVFAQQTYNGIIISSQTKEPIEGASILGDKGCNGVTTTGNGSFAISGSQSGKFTVSYIGHTTEVVHLTMGKVQIIELNPITSSLQEVVVSANREAVKRSMAPVAIACITR